MSQISRIDYRTDPTRYKHWQLSFDGPVATLAIDIDEDGGLLPGYKLKLNSYDLGVDIELSDALNRIRFERPDVRTVVITGAKERLFCSGANIFMLGSSSHPWKVNFCKFTNETRNGMEDSSRFSGLKFLAAINGVCAGGGYELALACDEIVLVDDRSSAISLPEVPLLGVLPGTGGLTRVTDKRHVRHDLADIFCTTVEGVRGQRAKDWKLVDDIAKPAVFAATVRERAMQLAAQSDRPENASGVRLSQLECAIESDRLRYEHVDVTMARDHRTATFTISGPADGGPRDIADIIEAGADWYPLALARQLDDAVLSMRSNELEIGTWILKTKGDPNSVLALDEVLLSHREHWFVRETIGFLRRALSRLDVSSRSLFSFVEPGSCFAGTLFELALASDRCYHMALPDDESSAPLISLSKANFDLYPMSTGQSRLARRFYDDECAITELRNALGRLLDADAAYELGLVTSSPDDLDWDDEVRIAIEERVAMSPDALTAMEANLRFNGTENMLTRIFSRLSAWQNWIFQRPNAVGEKGSLKVYGTGNKSEFDWNRV